MGPAHGAVVTYHMGNKQEHDPRRKFTLNVCPAGMLQLGICGLHHLLAISVL